LGRMAGATRFMPQQRSPPASAKPSRAAVTDFSRSTTRCSAQREQLRRGAVELPEAVAAWKLGVGIEKVRLVHARLIGSGILREQRRGAVGRIHTFDPATTVEGYGERLDGFKTKRTRTFRRLEVGQRPFVVIAHTDELARASARVRDLGAERAAALIEEHGDWHDGKAELRPVLTALEDAASHVHAEAPPPARTTAHDDEIPV
jgi:pyruvate/2-oxoglutarate dehydrogenase complex dihydrolipoamide acyltransferase (E2) component